MKTIFPSALVRGLPLSSALARCLGTLVLVAMICGCFLARAQYLISCSGLESGDFYERGFYIPSYPGISLDTARLEFSSYEAGNYSVTLTVRSNAYDGPVIGRATNHFALAGSIVENKPVTFNFGSLPIAPGTRVCFTLGLAASPAGNLFYSVPGFAGGCDQIVQTEGTTPPIDTVRRHGVNIVITGKEILTECAEGEAGDFIDRGFYIPQFRGVSLSSAGLKFSAHVAGAYAISLTVRSNTYNGPILGVNTQAVVLPGSSSTETPVTFVFPSIPIRKYSRVCFILSQVSGPDLTMFYSVPDFDSPCPEVIQTVGTTPPLDTVRRYGVELMLTGMDDPSQDIRLTIAEQPAGVRLRWNSAAGLRYTLQSTNLLQAGFGSMLTGILATPPTNSFDLPVTGASNLQFFRIMLEHPPVP